MRRHACCQAVGYPACVSACARAARTSVVSILTFFCPRSTSTLAVGSSDCTTLVIALALWPQRMLAMSNSVMGVSPGAIEP